MELKVISTSVASNSPLARDSNEEDNSVAEVAKTEEAFTSVADNDVELEVPTCGACKTIAAGKKVSKLIIDSTFFMTSNSHYAHF